MTTLSQFSNGVEPQRQNIDRRATVRRLLADLRAAKRALRQSIKVEEERTGIRDLTDPRYSADARLMRARADNMKITITILEAERSRA